MKPVSLCLFCWIITFVIAHEVVFDQPDLIDAIKESEIIEDENHNVIHDHGDDSGDDYGDDLDDDDDDVDFDFVSVDLFDN